MIFRPKALFLILPSLTRQLAEAAPKRYRESGLVLWLGPAIFLIVHAYVLLHLAGKVGDFDAELKVKIADEDARQRVRRQLPSNIFVQFLAGSREVRTGVLGFLLRAIAQISLVIGPIALLVFFELRFSCPTTIG